MSSFVKFRDILLGIDDLSEREWVYLPEDSSWTLDSKAITLESEEVPPELEDEEDAGIPALAKENKMMQSLSVGEVKSIVANARQQNPEVSVDELYQAFLYYYDNDAFISLA